MQTTQTTIGRPSAADTPEASARGRAPAAAIRQVSPPLWLDVASSEYLAEMGQATMQGCH